MAERFSASAAFTNMNNNSTDGWGDDWGDWNETPGSGATAVDAGPPKSFVPSKQPPPLAGPTAAAAVTSNHYFQQQQQQQQQVHPTTGGQYFDGPSHADQHNHNFLPNQSAPQAYSVASGNAGYQQVQATVQAPQQQTYAHAAPPQSYGPPQPNYGQANSFFNTTPAPSAVQQTTPGSAPSYRPPSHPPASTTPQLAPMFSQTISDSFDTSASNSWNWNNAAVDGARPSASVPQPPPESMTRDGMASKQAPPLPGQHFAEVQQPLAHALAPLPNAPLQRLKAETLSPQWSIESQVSSSDRSLESENNPDTHRSSQPPTTVPSDEDLSAVAMGTAPPQLAPARVDTLEGVGRYSLQPSPYPSYPAARPTPPAPTQMGVPDRLDEVLEALSIKQEPNEPLNRGSSEASYREQSFPPPPPSIAGTAVGPMVNDSLSHPSKSSSTTPPLPPPPVESGNAPGGGPPPSASVSTMVAGPPPKPPQSMVAPGAASNPFKRASGRSHIATPGLAMAPATAPPVVAPVPAANVGGGSPFYYQQQHQQPTLLQPPLGTTAHGEEANNVETLTPDNQEILVEPRTSEQVENHEIAPSNDRNQYLQTGHLSEDGYRSEVTDSGSTIGNSRAHPTPLGATASGVGAESSERRLPPPGLSRYVPGQNQQQPGAGPVPPPAGQSFPEPPPGLDRMVPGMDLHENASNLSLLERQADGEVSDGTPAAPVGLPSSAVSGSSSGHVSQHYHHHNHERVDMSDRNLYRVPGESDNHHLNQQRVVPGGLEHDRVPPAPASSTLSSASAYGPGVGGPTVPVVAPVGSSSTATGAMAAAATLDIPEEQRELVMDGENPDDRREEPLVGGNPDPLPTGAPGATAPPAGSTVETDSNVTLETARNQQEPSNTSTADESDKGGFYGGVAGGSKGGRREDDSLRRSNKSKSSRDRYDTEDSDYSEHERRRRDRESSLGAGAGAGAGPSGGTLADAGNQRHERVRQRMAGGGDRDKEGKRKDTGRERDRERDRDRGDRDRDQRDRGDRDYDYRDRERTRYDRDRERYGRGSKYDRDSRYETDGSKYETERSTRYEKDDKRFGASSRDDYYRKRDERGAGDDVRAPGPVAGGRDRDREGIERRQRKEKERADRYRGEDRRKDDRYREGEKRRERHDRRYDADDYRTGSRNGTERDRARDSRDRDDRKEKADRKYMAGYGAATGPAGAVAGAYGQAGGYYDPYSYYAQHQQYYEQLRRTNPQAYAEWYRTYYSQMQASQLQRDLLTRDDGRESVHSGRSSTNDKERFNRTTPFMHPPGLYNPEEYHRHYNNQSLPSAAMGAGVGGGAGPVSLLDQSYLSDVSGQPSSLPPMFQHAHAYQHQQQQVHSLLHQQQLHQQQQQQQLRATTSLALERTYNRGDAGGYFLSRHDQIDASIAKVEGPGAELSMMEPERLTPRKFPEIHPIVSVSAGLLISTKNRLTMNGMADTVKIFSLGYSDTSRKLFQAYPGPLVKGVTHKKSVIEFCEEQLRQGPPYSGALALIKSRGNSINSLHSSSLAAGVNRSSFALLWNYIILLLRQNGTFVGTDISELLMQNKTEYPFESSIQTSAIRSANISGRNSSLSVAAVERAPREADARQEDGESDNASLNPDAPGRREQDSKELLGPEGAVAKVPAGLSEQDITDKFRSYLLYGNIGEALEWATEHNLWGHALFLASKVDSRQHANVMMKFANKLTLNDPLQTLYQLLSGRTPASVTSVLDEKWGDWRPHLAMLMSNSSAKPELIKKSITTLGDTLYHRGDLYAAHFCYLLSDVAFGRFADVKQDASNGHGAGGAVRLVLLGAAHHHRNFRELSTNESIMMTEIYEYARSLNEDRYSIAELQRYKYLLACRMLDQGMQLKCLLYMEQIAEQIQHDSYRFDADFVRRVYTLGDRLKYYDPVMEKALDESVNNTGRGNIYANVEDPEWLKGLNEILLSGGNSSLGASNYNNNEGQLSYDYSSYGQGADYTQAGGAVGQEQSVASGGYHPTETSDINKQFNEISQQLGQLNLQYTDQQQANQQYQQPPANAPAASAHLPHQQSYDAAGAGPSYDQGYESINQQHSMMDPSSEQAASAPQPLPDANNYDQPPPQQQFGQYNNYDQQQQQSVGGANIFTPAPPAAGQDHTAAPGPYDGAYWGAAPAGNSEVPTPTISMPNAVSNRAGFSDETDDERRNGAANGGPKPPQSNANAQAKKAAPGKGPLGGAPGGAQQGSGWFGGIWNKLSMKPKNQMILPDDKNPKIVWDEVSKRWVNTDEAEAATEAYKPPPKLSDLMPAASGPPSAVPGPAPPPVPSPIGPAVGGGGPGPVVQSTQDAALPGTYAQHPNAMGANAGGMQQQPMAAAPVPSHAPTAAAGPTSEPTKVPTLQSNMYKMQRNRTLKRSYVDVFNPSGAGPRNPTEPVLAPTVPSMPSAPGGFFVPGGAPNAGGQPGQQPNDAGEGMPQFYNPNQFGGASSYQQ